MQMCISVQMLQSMLEASLNSKDTVFWIHRDIAEKQNKLSDRIFV